MSTKIHAKFTAAFVDARIRAVFRVLLGMYNFAPDENSRSLQQQQHMNLESYIDPMTLNI